jgi:sugar lactone lactonase YvrE
VNTVELVVPQEAILGEGPCWDWRKNVLYWIDGFGCRAFVYDPISGVNTTFEMGSYVGCIAPTRGENLLVSLQDGFYILDPKTARTALLANPEAEIEGNRFNDGKVDGRGRFWCGSMSMNESGGKCDFEPTGALYRMNQDLSITKALDHVTLSNGLAWSADDSTFFYIDTPTMRVDAFDFDSASGTLSNRRTVIEFPENEGVPDGLTIDQDETLWIGHYNGGRVSRWDPRTGKKLEEVFVPALHATSCTFGGEGLRDLYITTARVNTEKSDLRRFPDAGGLFRVRVGAPGFRTNVFSGAV